MATIKVNNKSVSYTYGEPTRTVKLSTGLEFNVTGSIAQSAIQKAFDALPKAPIIEPPVIIPPASSLREIDNKQLAVLRDIDGGNFVLKPGIYTQRCDLTNVKNITIDGLGKVQFETGERAIQFNGAPPSGVHLNGFSFKNINDYCVDFWKHSDNPLSNPTKGFKFTNMSAESCGAILHIDGELNKGMVIDLIIQNIKFTNSKEPRSAVYAGNAKNYSISNCLVDNINFARNVIENGKVVPNGTHNGVFQMGGWGKFFNNKITNHQGNALRAWLFSQDELGLVEIFNNFVYQSWKYGAFEVQNKLGGKPADAKVYNNTVGKMNASNDWEGQLLDLYNTGGKLEYYNNLGFEMVKADGLITNMINNMSDVKITESNNKYFKTQNEAVNADLSSKVKGIGAQ